MAYSYDPSNIFARILRGEIPNKTVLETPHTLAFHDIHAQAPVHVLVIPKRHITSLATATAEDTLVLGKILAKANGIAVEQGSPEGFRVIINTGRVGQQEVQHLHAHIVGGPDPVGPMLKRI